jgi:Lysylphosphatidylglycerol synthase TM region
VLPRLARLARYPQTRVALLAVVLGFCSYGLYAEWPQVAAGLARLHWYSVALSLLAAMCGSACMMLAWRAVLADLGSPLPAKAAAKISFVSQLGKYVPGAVWAFAAQVELGHDLGVPRRRSVASVAVALAVTIGAGLGVAALALPLASPGTARHYWWVLVTVPVIVIGLCPPVLGPVIDRGLALVRRQPLERRLGWRGLAHALIWTLLGWLLLGVQVWLVQADMAGQGRLLLVAVGGYALAFSAGLLLFVFPSGIGAREVILIATLTTVMPHGTAVAIALVTRGVTTASDLALGGIGMAMGRGAKGAVLARAGRHAKPGRWPGPDRNAPADHGQQAAEQLSQAEIGS